MEVPRGTVGAVGQLSMPSPVWLDEAELTKIKTERKIKWLNNFQTFSRR